MKYSNPGSSDAIAQSAFLKHLIASFLLGISLLAGQARAEMVTYGIGNSLTLDMFFNYTGKGIDIISSGTGNPTRTGEHLNCSENLTRIWSNPDETCFFTPSFGKYQAALSGPRIDNLVLQPHYGASIANEIQSIKNFIDLAKQNPLNTNTRFFLYAPWGSQTDTGTGQSFYDTWHNFSATLAGNYAPSRSTFDLMMRELEGAGYDVALIPVGHAWISTIDAIRAGTQIDLITLTNGVPGTASLREADLWRDPIHASSVGSFIAGVTAFSAFYGTEPVGLDPLAFSFQTPVTFDYFLSPNGGRQVEQIAWSSYLSAIPEPNSLAFVGCMLTATLLARRRH